MGVKRQTKPRCMVGLSSLDIVGVRYRLVVTLLGSRSFRAIAAAFMVFRVLSPRNASMRWINNIVFDCTSRLAAGSDVFRTARAIAFRVPSRQLARGRGGTFGDSDVVNRQDSGCISRQYRAHARIGGRAKCAPCGGSPGRTRKNPRAPRVARQVAAARPRYEPDRPGLAILGIVAARRPRHV